MKLVFLPEALRDIDRLYDFLVDDNPIAAQKAMLAIDEGITLLLENPYLGGRIGLSQNEQFPRRFDSARLTDGRLWR